MQIALGESDDEAMCIELMDGSIDLGEPHELEVVGESIDLVDRSIDLDEAGELAHASLEDADGTIDLGEQSLGQSDRSGPTCCVATVFTPWPLHIPRQATASLDCDYRFYEPITLAEAQQYLTAKHCQDIDQAVNYVFPPGSYWHDKALAASRAAFEDWPFQRYTLASIYTCLVACAVRMRIAGATLLDFIEGFAGAGAISQSLVDNGQKVRSFDLCISKEHDVLTKEGLRRWIMALLSTRIGAGFWCAFDCSSFVCISSSKARRVSANDYLGDQARPFVRRGNEILLRSAMMILLALLTSVRPVVEQPTSSVAHRLSMMSKLSTYFGVCRVPTYLGAFGAPSLKAMKLLGFGDAGPWVRRLRRAPPVGKMLLTLAIKHRTKNGKRAFTGKPQKVKQSACYTLAFGQAVASAFMQ